MIQQHAAELLLSLFPVILFVAVGPWLRARLKSALSWRARGLIESRRSIGQLGDAETKAALQREIDDIAFRRLSSFGAAPPDRSRLIELNRRHPVAAAWPALKGWRSVIETQSEMPRLKPNAIWKYRVCAIGYGLCLGSAAAFYLVFGYYMLFPDIPTKTRAVGAAVSLLYMVPGLLWASMIPNPYHYLRLRDTLRGEQLPQGAPLEGIVSKPSLTSVGQPQAQEEAKKQGPKKRRRTKTPV